ncbi:MAG: hypothetical protein JWQ87_1352 [Candidatus Sulfotelmatobacter sp.]|nr:hypothetical protein [Candidatus Sulfotelmatobacter sp.]
MKCSVVFATLVATLLALSAGASAREVVLPAGTLLQCTMNEPNFSSSTVDVGDPVLCHLKGITEFGQQAFPRGSYLVGHLEAAKDPGHFWGKGYLKIQFDRIGLPSGDLPLEAKVIATRGYKVDKAGKIDGKGHPKRDVAEWMLPPLWPWKVIMLPARGPRPKLKGETVLSLRLMDDVQVPQVAKTYGLGWHFFNNRPQRESYLDSQNTNVRPTLAVRGTVTTARADVSASVEIPQPSYANLVSRVVNSGSTGTNSPVFVLKTGTVLAVGNYQYQDGRITYTLAGGGGGVLSSEDVDWNMTTQVNNQHGVRMTLHGGHVNPETAGF